MSFVFEKVLLFAPFTSILEMSEVYAIKLLGQPSAKYPSPRVPLLATLLRHNFDNMDRAEQIAELVRLIASAALFVH